SQPPPPPRPTLFPYTTLFRSPPRPLPRLGAGNPSTPAQSPAWRFRALACAGLLLALSPAEGATFRWASSSNRIYVENGGTATLSDIKGALPNAPLDLVDPVNGVWLLRASLIVEDGSTLLVQDRKSVV